MTDLHEIKLPAEDWNLICEMFRKSIEMTLRQYEVKDNSRIVESVFRNLQACDENVHWAPGFGYHNYF